MHAFCSNLASFNLVFIRKRSLLKLQLKFSNQVGRGPGVSTSCPISYLTTTFKWAIPFNFLQICSNKFSFLLRFWIRFIFPAVENFRIQLWFRPRKFQSCDSVSDFNILVSVSSDPNSYRKVLINIYAIRISTHTWAN